MLLITSRLALSTEIAMRSAWIYAFVCSIIIPFQGLIAQDIERDILELSAGPSILSSISGSRAVKELTEVDRWQKLLSLTPEELDELRVLNSGIEIDEKIKKLGTNKKPKELKILREQLIQLRLSDILDPNQQSIIEAAKSISEFRIKKEMEVLLSELSVMPRDFQEKLKQLVKGVWE